jgi:hypothetical protein
MFQEVRQNRVQDVVAQVEEAILLRLPRSRCLPKESWWSFASRGTLRGPEGAGSGPIDIKTGHGGAVVADLTTRQVSEASPC